MKTFLAALLTAASLSAQAADYFLPHIEADGSANVHSIHPGYPTGRAQSSKRYPTAHACKLFQV
ncbi:Uncharacterised protein [Helicobacter pametensis]|nr:Uncharacterised protein [Helicobacter pametensis]